MHYKRYRPIILTLLITTNITAMEKTELISPRNIIMFSALAIVSIALLSKVRTLITHYLQTHFSSQSTVSESMKIANNELIINNNGYSEQDLAQLSLIMPSGTMKSLPLDPIEHVAVSGNIATVHIDDEQTPRIEIDEAFNSNLLFTVKNGLLAVTTPDNKPRKFAYNRQPLCTIYAKLLATKLIASSNSYVLVKNQKLNTITSSGSSTIRGTVQPIEQLNLTARNSSDLILQNINCTDLTLNASSSATVKLFGKTTNQDITISGSSNYKASGLITQHGIIRARASGSSDITVTGNANNQNIELSNSSNYKGLALCAKNTTINCSNSSDAKLHVTEQLVALAQNSSSIRYKGNPKVRKTCRNSSDCKQLK